jgi:ABC-type polysaccharide/polyol phosphate transport system ATPase subunit
MIRLHDVSLTRRVQDDRSLDLKRTMLDVLRGRYRPPQRKSVLRAVSLTIEAGERLGIIGRNGAGKSTLLKVIAGIIPPSAGTVEVKGVVAPLIELGAGFDPDLSVIDNIVLYGVLLGFDYHAMQARVGPILEFAQLGEFAHALVKTLSSGMWARLGFAVASDLEPDVLLLDEVFAVGDEEFRRRSRERIERLWNRGTTSIVVSHDLPFIVETCTRAICLAGGRVAVMGDPRPAARFYIDTLDA